jgi:hypothetical protein
MYFVSEKTIIMKEAETPTTKVLPVTCCVISTYTQPLLYPPVRKVMRNEAQTALYLLIREMKLLFVFWYEKYVLHSTIQSKAEYYCMNSDNIATRRNSYVRDFCS